MNAICRTMSTAALAAALAICAHAAQKTKCTDDPINFTISASYVDPYTSQPYTSRILPDSGGPYVNGQNGVTATIKTCEGTDDAVLSLGKSRTLTINLQSAVATTSKTPSWVSGPVEMGGINVWNLLYNYQPSAYYTFTTGLGGPGVNSPDYYYRVENPNRDASRTTDSGANSPCMTALVNVAHYPAGYLSPSSPETWRVWPNSAPTTCTSGQAPIQVGTLFLYTNSLLNVGQFATPFFITIERQ